jgi:uncharacterized membrane protein YhaH (DUF805 family)
MFRPLIRYADFRGRSRRSEFWRFYLLILLITVVCVSVGAVAGSTSDVSGDEIAFGVLGLAYLALTIPWYAVMVRRLHDVDKSGWWIFAALIPFGIVALITFWVRDGTSGDNRFGPDPKSRPSTAVTGSEAQSALSA